MLNAAAKAVSGAADRASKRKEISPCVDADEGYGSVEHEGGVLLRDDAVRSAQSGTGEQASSDMLVKSHMDTYRFPANITNGSNNYGSVSVSGKAHSADHQQCASGKEAPGIR